MENNKRYWIKKTNLLDNTIYYAVKGSSNFIDFRDEKYMKISDRLTICQDEIIELYNGNIQVSIFRPCTIEFEEVKEEYVIAIFDITTGEYTLMKESYMFTHKDNIKFFNSIESVEEIHDKVEGDYISPILILQKCDNTLYDVKTGLSINKLPLYLKILEMQNSINSLPNKDEPEFDYVLQMLKKASNYILDKASDDVDD